MNAGSSRKILLVEDNAMDVELTVRAFQKNRITNELVVLNDGIQAIDYIKGTGRFAGRDRRELPAVVLLDIKLPKLDGFEVLRRIRTDDHTRLVPVVLLTSSNEEKDKIAGYDLGANSFVRKPIDFERFVEATGMLAAYWLALNEPPGV
jgi:two-component system response regulator